MSRHSMPWIRTKSVGDGADYAEISFVDPIIFTDSFRMSRHYKGTPIDLQRAVFASPISGNDCAWGTLNGPTNPNVGIRVVRRYTSRIFD